MRSRACSRSGSIGLVTALAVALVLTGCANKQAAGAGSGLTITSPAAGASVTSPVQLTISAGGEKIGQPSTGDRHFHVRVDGSSQYQILYSTSGSVDVPAGQHTIEVVLTEPNHTETETSASVTVTVTGGAGSASPSGGGGYGNGGGGGYGSGGYG